MSNEQNEIYCSFWIGDTEFALDIIHVHEVLNYPTDIIPAILAPSFLCGFINLRGDVLPIVDLSSTLGLPPLKSDSNKALAVVVHQDILVAIIVDRIGQIIRPKNYKKTMAKNESTDSKSYIKSVLNAGSTEKLVQVIDLETIMLFMNSAQEEKPKQRLTQKGVSRNSQYSFAKFITFTLNNQKFAFPIGKVNEVVLSTEIQESAFQSHLCSGFLRLRGRVIPVFNLDSILNIETNHDDKQGKEKQRVLIFRNKDYELGVLVDAIEGIQSCPSTDVSPLSLLGSNKSQFLLGCISIPAFGDRLILDSDPIFRSAEIIELIEGHKSIYRDEQLTQTTEVSKKQTYISFSAHHLFGVKLSEVEGILEDLAGTTKATKAEPYVEGIIKYRDDLITLICPRKYYGLASIPKNLSQSVAVIIKIDNKKFGLIVDSIESLLSLDLNTSFKLPNFYHEKLMESLQNDISEIVSLRNRNNSNVSLMILDVPSLAGNIKLAS